MSGFVYIWFDIKRKMFYIGSRWGDPSGSYICSSNWMKRAFKRRPLTFKRRILSFHFDRGEMLQEEERLLQMISDAELGTKYYNLHRRTGHWHGKSDISIVIEKMKASWTPERKARQSGPNPWSEERLTAFRAKTVGRKRTPETKALQRAAKMALPMEQRVVAAKAGGAATARKYEIERPFRLTPKQTLEKARAENGYLPPNRSSQSKKMWNEIKQDQTRFDAIHNSMSRAAVGKVCIVNILTGKSKRVRSTELEAYLNDGWIKGRTLTPRPDTLRKQKAALKSLVIK